uniref:Mitochondrial resolvase Ydc2 catalytic domain-containing protein n=1 Tax=viral metagenome TaxID=1070528 RepID=A0A6C0DHV1_9ZZZZ
MYMRILSIDVGIKNLAFCLFEKNTEDSHFSIQKWDIINLSQEDEIAKCHFVEKNNNICNKPAKYAANDKCFCLKHSKKQDFQLPNRELKASFINKQKIQILIDIADKYGIHYEKPCKKNDLLFKINEYISKKCFKEIETTNASQIDLITIGKNIKNKFNNVFPLEEKIDYVLIENQISPIANRMKTIQGMIAQYFIMNNTQHIEFISSINKLKCQDNKQDNKPQNSNDYKSRKKQGIQKCLEILTSDFRFNNQIEYFNIHKKKDDLSDSFLQGMWFINKQNL